MIKSNAKFLFILYFTPPAPGTAPKRNFRILKYIAGQVQHSILFTAKYPDKPPVKIPKVETHAIMTFDYRTILRQNTQDGYLPEQHKTARWKQWGIKFINTFPINILIGEGGLLYVNSVIRQANRLIHQQNITHVYSSFRPFADHYIAYRLKKKNPALLWIADFRDLIIDPHYKHHLFGKKQESYFRKMFSFATLMTTVSDGLALKLKAYNPNVAVIRNGIDTDYHVPPAVSSGYFTITYTGSMFLNTRNARPLFDALKSLSGKDDNILKDVRIEYAGKDSFHWNKLAAAYLFESILVDHGFVSDDDAKRIQSQSCMNLLLTISSPELTGVLTGKMIEYFESGSPVLGIVVGQNDPELQNILTELEIGNSFSDSDLMGIENFIYQEYLSWKKSGMNRKPVNVDVLKRKYSMDEIMMHFALPLNPLKGTSL
ncbi:MAG TPA: hypothetical protein VFV79_01260 [Saprospiraceae bacterium]|nr:hypothetical protein [Saprospiraceae bacterium]